VEMAGCTPVPAKIFIINRMAITSGCTVKTPHSAGIRRLFAWGWNGAGAISHHRRLIAFPFAVLYLLLYAFAVLMRGGVPACTSPVNQLSNMKHNQISRKPAGPEEMVLVDAPVPAWSESGADQGGRAERELIDVTSALGFIRPTCLLLRKRRAPGPLRRSGRSNDFARATASRGHVPRLLRGVRLWCLCRNW